MPDGDPIIIGQPNTANDETSLSRAENTADTVFVARNLNVGDGIHGETNDGLGVSGFSRNSIGVSGTSSGSFRSGIGVFGTGPGAGVQGESGEAGVHGIGLDIVGMGVFGNATDSGVGVLGQSANGIAIRGVKANGVGTAAEFLGRVRVNGVLEKSGGGFKIDHPLAPADMYLNHSFVESSEMKNVYDGVARLDEDGAAWVDLPEWFEALNGDFRYQLTAVGGSAPNLHVAEEISGNRFKIAGGQEGMKVCWQVTGTRKDPWAADNPFEVEQEKPEEERGRYLDPSLYDAPEEQGVMTRPLPEGVAEEQRPPEPSDIDLARLEEEYRRGMEELRRRMEEHEEEAPPEST